MSSNNKEGIILEEAGYRLDEVTRSIEDIMVDLRKKAKTHYKRELIFKGVMAGQNEKAGMLGYNCILTSDKVYCNFVYIVQ